MDRNVLVIVGPTASGKTSISIKLAEEFNGEIVSADSMQIYKYMDIGTAKPTIEEMRGIRHHLIDELYPDEEFSVASYYTLANKYIDEILSRGKLPIVVGGTGLYIKALTENMNFTETVCDWDFRERMKLEAQNRGNSYLHDKLKAVDEEAARKIHVNDVKRVIRALEVYEYTKLPISEHRKRSIGKKADKRFVFIGLTMDRDKLYDRINKRVDIMVENGLIDEVENLINNGYTPGLVSMQGLGYKEVVWYLQGKLNLDEMLDLLKRDTRRYAKRQYTWFRRNEDIKWIDIGNEADSQHAIKIIKDYLAINGII